MFSYYISEARVWQSCTIELTRFPSLSLSLRDVSLSEEERAIFEEVASHICLNPAKLLKERHVVSAHLSSGPPSETDSSHKQFDSLELRCWFADWSYSKATSLWVKERRVWRRGGEGEERVWHFYSDVKAEMLINVHWSCHINWINNYQTKAGGEAHLQTRKWKFHLVRE